MRRFFLMLFISLAAVIAWGQGLSQRVSVFEMNEDGSKFYRIPALVKAKDGSLVVIADKRGNSLADLPNIISIVAKRSTDGGKTWGSMVTIAQGNSAAGTTYGDPAVVLDEETGNLVTVFVGNENYYNNCVGLWASNKDYPLRLYKSVSSDNGVTWTAPEDISESVYNGIYGSKSNWIGLFAGSGNGLQLKQGSKAGRLMFVVAARVDSSSGGVMRNYAIYSDDNGATWNVSNNYACNNGDEAKVVETESGEVIMSIKNRNKGYRLFSRSTDGGETWTSAVQNTDVLDPACNGDMIKYEHDGKYYLLHSMPGSSSTRENVTVYLSSDGGTNWDIKRQVYTGYSAYSSLAVLNDGTIGIVIEEGKWDGNLPGDDGFNLAYYNFTLDWLLGDTEPVLPVTEGVLDLNGSRYMSIANSSDFDVPAGGTAGFTVTCKVKIPEYVNGSNMRFVANRAYEGTDNNSTVGYEIIGGNSASNAVSANISFTGSAWGNGFGWQTGLVEDKWTHVSWVIDGTTMYLYVDGVLKETKTGRPTSGIQSKADMLIGAGYTNNNGYAVEPAFFAKGYIDDVRFYNKALSAADVASDMTSTVNTETEALVAAYDFENIVGYSVEDISGNGHTGTLVGFPEEVQYTVTVSATEGGTATVNGDVSALVWDGETALLEATSADGYKFAGWLLGNSVVSTENPYTVTVTDDTEYVARFIDSSIIEYTHIDGNSTHASRRLDSFTITDGISSLDVTSIQPTYKSSMYSDKTHLVLATAQGAELKFSAFNWDGWWMHAYAYIDYNLDGNFNQTLNIDGKNDGELVSYNFYSSTGSNTGYDSRGNLSNAEHANENSYNGSKGLPSFVLPANLPSGDYRMRIKIDWNNLDSNGDADIKQNGGCQCDFIIRIADKTALLPVVADSAKIGVACKKIFINGYSGDVQVMNMLGQVVSEMFVIEHAEINVPAGMYIVRVGEQHVKVLVKE